MAARCVSLSLPLTRYASPPSIPSVCPPLSCPPLCCRSQAERAPLLGRLQQALELTALPRVDVIELVRRTATPRTAHLQRRGAVLDAQEAERQAAGGTAGMLRPMLQPRAVMRQSRARRARRARRLRERGEQSEVERSRHHQPSLRDEADHACHWMAAAQEEVGRGHPRLITREWSSTPQQGPGGRVGAVKQPSSRRPLNAQNRPNSVKNGPCGPNGECAV